MLPQGLQVLFQILVLSPDCQNLRQILRVQLAEGLLYAVRHAVVEVDDGLPAVLVILIGLNGNTCQGGIGGDIVGLPQEAVPGGEAALEQLLDVDLGTGRSQGVEVQIVDVDVALLVCLSVFRLQNEHLVELLGPLAAILEHGSHSSIAVYVGILPLDVRLNGIGEGDLLISLHEPGVHLAGLAALVAVKDVRFGGFGEVLLHQDFFYDVLDVLHFGSRYAFRLNNIDDHLGQSFRRLLHISKASGGKRFVNGIGDFLGVKGDVASVSLAQGFNSGSHDKFTPFKFKRSLIFHTNTTYSGIGLYTMQYLEKISSHF